MLLSIKRGLIDTMKKTADHLVPLKVTLNGENILSESFLSMFGETVKIILRRMFDGDSAIPPGVVKGTPAQINSFESALVANKRYIDSYIQNGLNNPSTYRSKYDLERAVANFERQTGIRWPFG